MAKVAILGYGTVGSGVDEVIEKNAEGIARRAGEKIEIAYIVDIRDFSTHPKAALFTRDFEAVLDDPSVGIIAEVIGGIKPAYEYTKRALLAGKSVVTSNKELVATYGAELLNIAKKQGVSYLFEASVGGGIPIIRPLHQCLAANEISEIMGILNGTTNYILTKMLKEGMSFERALSDAQQKGYAEANPAADIEGHDACRKISILSSLAFGSQVDANKVHTEGICGITLVDMQYASQMGYAIKLIGLSRRMGSHVFARVSPLLLPMTNSLSGVDDVFNGITVLGDAIGEVMFYGKGAGKLPTASAVVGDIIDIVRKTALAAPIVWDMPREDNLVDIEDTSSAWFVRAGLSDLEAVKALGYAIHHLPGQEDEFAFIIPHMSERDAKRLIGKLGLCKQKIRIQLA